jgi:hypothetical protein
MVAPVLAITLSFMSRGVPKDGVIVYNLQIEYNA